MVFAIYDNIISGVRNATNAVATAWIPEKPWVATFGVVALWYGRRVALTYAPGYLADYFIKITVAFVGNQMVGKSVGAAFVAPIMVPSITPWAAFAFGSMLFYIACVIGNLVQKYFC